MIKESMGSLIDMIGCCSVIHSIKVYARHILSHQVNNLIHSISQTSCSQRLWVMFVFIQNSPEFSWQLDILTGLEQAQSLIAIENRHNPSMDWHFNTR